MPEMILDETALDRIREALSRRLFAGSCTPFKSGDMGEGPEFMALPGKPIDVMLDKFAMKPRPDDKLRPAHSIGVGLRSLVATDGVRAVVAGEVDDEYMVTDRRRAMLEADREGIYRDGFDANRLVPRDGEPDPENAPPEGDYPKIGPIVAKVDGMRHLASLSPEALADVARLANACGATSMDLFLGSHRLGESEVPLLGFKFTYYNDAPRFGEALEVPFVGLVLGMKSSRSEAQDEDILPDPHVEATASEDDLFPRAVRFVVELGFVSTSALQREFNLGFVRADSLMRRLEEAKVVGPRNGGKPRKALMSETAAEELLSGGGNE